MEIDHETTKRLHAEGICMSFGEARRIQHAMPDKEKLEEFIEKRGKSKKL